MTSDRWTLANAEIYLSVSESRQFIGHVDGERNQTPFADVAEMGFSASDHRRLTRCVSSGDLLQLLS